jgi:FtsP/CotA-like multicopper oxidase with cupredoxin domain
MNGVPTSRIIGNEMHHPLSRRSLLAGAAVAAAMPGATGFEAHAADGPTRIALAAERRVIEVNGRAASVFGIRRPDGSPGMVLDPGQRFSVDLTNRCAEDTIVHWHGQTPPFLQDGVAETGGTILKPGTVQAYDFLPRPGTHWMHSHHGLQEPLIVRTSDDVKADVQEVTVLLHDFSFKDPAELLAKVVGSVATPCRVWTWGSTAASHPAWAIRT